ncbi:Protein FAM222A [Merluccius polli]|uniref:Protein FAM222A n=1 Tax=Merluccius polli TaxID=89951 RepID=A0AA47NSN3_MERPO|nr:Protein FAM222A [Merluccius polli]
MSWQCTRRNTPVTSGNIFAEYNTCHVSRCRPQQVLPRSETPCWPASPATRTSPPRTTWCAPGAKVLELVPPLALALPAPPSQPYAHKGVSVSVATRYPTPAELDAFAHRTASSPLSITIFPSNIRVPQHKQLNRTVNGLDTTGQRYSPYAVPPSGGSRGLLAVVKGSTAVAKAVVKNSDGKRTKHAPPQTLSAPYSVPLAGGYAGNRQLHKAYDHGGSGTPQVAATDGPSSGATATARGRQAPPPPERARLSEARGPPMRRVNGQTPPPPPLRGGEARVGPSHQAVAAVACSHSGFAVPGVPPAQSSPAFSGAVLPTQSADMAEVGYLEGGEYGAWQHKHQHQQQHQQQQQQQQQHHHLQQQYHQGVLRMFSSTQGGRGAESTQSSLQPGGSTRLSYRPHPLSAGAGGGAAPEQISSHAAGFSLGPRYFAGPSWDGLAAATPHPICYAQELALLRDTGHAHAHPHSGLDPHPHHLHHRSNQAQCHPPPTATAAPQQAYSAEQGVCSGLVPPRGAAGPHASVLSSSLQSLECLISEIHPPCIKERMLGRGYEAVGLARLLEHHHHHHHHPHPLPLPHHPHIQLPVYR